MLQAFKTLQEYLKKEKGTRTKFSPIQEVQFPALTICAFPSYNLKNAKENGLQDINDYRKVSDYISFS